MQYIKGKGPKLITKLKNRQVQVVMGKRTVVHLSRKIGEEIASFKFSQFPRLDIQDKNLFPLYGFSFCWVLSSLTTTQKALLHRQVTQSRIWLISHVEHTPCEHHSDSGQDKCTMWCLGRWSESINRTQLGQKLLCECVSDISSTWKTSFTVPWYKINFFFWYF